ncbi:hypothetical protein SK128_018701 [Halocaridina rubra]|uniref:Neurotransmitter-gated ion-channel transmembrane domain-containing protein n=1 Tax=Halocaridina rubra TaxID=373956 RepID=A0AAN8XGL8_HALRR
MALSWSDIRLQYLNLKELADINLIEISKVWTPKVEYMNADFPFVYETPATLKVKRAAPAEPDDPILVKHDEVYMGSKNPLLMSKKVNAPFSCALDLKNFPFDTQRCQLLLRLSSARLEFLQWNQLEVYYLGEVWLTEYKVDKVDIESQEEEEYSMAVISITFRRRFWFYITSSYLPTVMLMLISYTSLYLKRDNVDLRVMMTLTALLVLYALYQQIADGLPRTSYTKAIDVWCFFAITFIFSQVIFQVLVDIRIKPKPKRDRNRVSILLQRICWSEGSKPEVNEKWEEEEEVKEYDEKTSKPLRAARIGYAIIVLLFLIIYWTVVISNMEN